MIEGIIPEAENCQKIRIEDYVHQARSNLKEIIVNAQIAISGNIIRLCKSDTRFGGTRLWFECPRCYRRVAILYNNFIAKKPFCRKCMRQIAVSND